MKRSEVLGKIFNILYPYVDLMDDGEFITNEILDELEKLGMLPPNMAIVNGEFNQKKFNYIVNKGINCNQWEKE